MLARQKATYYTPEEYLTLEEKADYKSEYYQDEIFAMAGASINHNRIINNLNAVLNIVEVLSKSTRDYDRGAKFELYRAIGSFQDYVLIDQERPYIEYFHKLDDGRWLLSDFKTLDATLTLETIDFNIPIRRIYHKVDWLE